jgi:hypothetical protein
MRQTQTYNVGTDNSEEERRVLLQSLYLIITFWADFVPGPGFELSMSGRAEWDLQDSPGE